MAALKKIFNFAINNSSSAGCVLSQSQFNLLKRNTNLTRTILANPQIRCISFYPIAENLQYVSNDTNLKIKVDKDTMKLSRPIEKPLCYMFTWLNAKNDHITKYANIYLDKGFDIFNATCTPYQIMFPVQKTQPVAQNILKFMESNVVFDPVVLHGFSVGSYMWGETCKYASQDLPRYQPVMDRFCTQVWDSVPDLSEFTIGVARGQFPHNPILQMALYNYSKFHLWFFHNSATIHYNTASVYFHNNLLRAPCLFLLSKTDPVGAEKSVRGFGASWEKLGVKTTYKCWDDSPHVQHIHTHPEEYVEAVDKHLKATVPLLKDL